MTTLARIKTALSAELAERGMGPADLMRLMACSRTATDRILSPVHSSTLDQMDRAFWALGLSNAITATAIRERG